jgi:hypothetical protein
MFRASHAKLRPLPDPQQTKRCFECKTYKLLCEFPTDIGSRDSLHRVCVTCQLTRAQDHSISDKYARKNRNHRQRLWNSSYSRARECGIEHSIKVSDIPSPKRCRYLGVELDYTLPCRRGSRRQFNAPSIDRIDPSLGYIVGNIQIISDLANRMKSDATIEQMIAFAQGVLTAHS